MSILNSPRLLQTPIWPYQVNHLSDQAHNLECWVPVSGGGNYADLAGRGAVFTPSGAPMEVGGLDGPAVRLLAASSQYLSRPIGACTFSKSTKFSGSIWSRWTATSTGAFFSTWEVNTLPGWSFRFNNTTAGDISFFLADAPGGGKLARTTSGGFNDGNWHHLAFTYSGSGLASGMTLYVDGRALSLTLSDGADPGTLAGSTLYIGRLGAAVPQYQDHDWRDMRIAAREWSAAEVWAQYDPATRYDLYWSPWMAGVGTAPAAPIVGARNGDFNISLA